MATPEQWAQAEEWADNPVIGASDACLLELRARVELLEATQHTHIEAVQPTVKESLMVDSTLAASLVERVAAAIALADEEHYWPTIGTTAADRARDDMARAAMREVLAWLKEGEHTWAALKLEQEVER